jgi:ubiquinone biosynthesis protein
MFNVMRLNRNVRSIRRTRIIIGVFVSYGFDQLLESFNVPSPFRKRRFFRREQREVSGLDPARRMRLAFEELGPTFIKLGQLLSTRPDLIPRSFADEFALLQDRVPSVPLEEIRRQLQQELGQGPEALFARFNPEPLATASIAQVHRARLKSGEEVAVKIRRPDIVAIVETDIDILSAMAGWGERHLPAGSYDLPGVVREFARTIRREMDLAREGRTIERFRSNAGGDPTQYFPKIYPELTSSGVLTLEYVRGIKVSDLDALRHAGLDCHLIAARGADLILHQVVDHGLFHGDPHPGNIFILPGNVICLLDFGMVGHLEGVTRQFLFRLLLALINKAPDELIECLDDAGLLAEASTKPALRRDLAEFIDSYVDIPLRELRVGRLLSEFIDIITLHRIRLDPDLLLLVKALIGVEGLGRRLDPDFDMMTHIRPFIQAAVKEQATPGEIVKDFSLYLQSLFRLSRNLPRDLREIITRINRGTVKIDLEHRGLDRLITELDKASNRLSASLIIAALLVGSAIIVTTDKGPKLFGFPFLALIGYVVAGIFGLWLVIAIFRSGRL